MKSWIIRIGIIFFMISFILSIMYIVKNEKEDKKQNKEFKELEKVVVEEQNKQQKDSINLQKLYEMNNDFVGWLKIENTNISYPIMKTEKGRKDYYLRKNFYKQYSYLGTPYISENCDLQKSDNLIIYGHHITRNKMFGELEKYKNKEFYNAHKIINFNTIYENADYEIIAVLKTIAYTGFQYYNFINANSRQEFDTFVKRCKELSFYNIEKTAEYGDKLLTLSTCEYSKKNGRLVVIAKKITNILEE